MRLNTALIADDFFRVMYHTRRYTIVEKQNSGCEMTEKGLHMKDIVTEAAAVPKYESCSIHVFLKF